MEKSLFEAELIEGLEEFGAIELKKIGGRLEPAAEPRTAGVLRFRTGKSLDRLQKLRVVNQVFQVHYFDVPRPKALLGQQHFDRIQHILHESIKRLGQANVRSFRLEAAGRDSAVFQRLISQIEQLLKITHEPEAGDLFLRVKPAVADRNKKGWELLVRQTLRPLATREWRRFNYPGALAAPVAALMLNLAAIHPDDVVLNMMCGSGTLLAETDEHVGMLVGCDLNLTALAGARLNLDAAGVKATLFPADAVQLPFAEGTFDLVLADLPWGQLVGEGVDLPTLYTHVLQEGWRVTRPGGQFVIVTQLKKLMLQTIKSSGWVTADHVSLNMGRVNPDVFLLNKPI